jgi:hypothetical protein
MKKNLLAGIFVISALFTVANAQKQIELDGIKIPRTITIQNSTLQLNGAGSRSKMWVDVYIQALYLSQLSQDPNEILDSDTAMSIRIQVTSALVSSGKLTRAMNTGFEKSSGEALTSLKPKIELFKSMLTDEITERDVFNLFYNPNDTSIWVFKNDQLKGKIPGFEFKKALFGIWISDKPVDEELKKNLLGQ